mmetsp:Transcript_85335/g.135247  ORF Transcript_85335/g.135247 Transcript_85335/m.135247 type:complete len:372 (+) Transcript_85335:17-1132(+)
MYLPGPTNMVARIELSHTQAAMLLALGLPCVLIHLLDYIGSTSSQAFRRDVVALEMFSGSSGVYAAFRRSGMTAARYDIALDADSMDFTTVYGYIVALQYLLRVRAGGLLFGGLPCSLHVWMSRGTSKKTRANPRGLLGEGLGFAADCVRVANLIAARYAIMALICLVRSIFWLTEQPSSSVAQFLPYIVHALHPDQMMVGFAGAVIQRMWMGLFGHRSLKRTVLWGNWPYAHLFSLQSHIARADRERFKWNSAGNTKISKTRDGKKNVSGGKKLRSTQEYPMPFCSRIASYHKMYCIEPGTIPMRPDQQDLEHGPHGFAPHDLWDDAGLEPFVDFLKTEMQQGRFKPRWPDVPFTCVPMSREMVGIFFQP